MNEPFVTNFQHEDGECVYVRGTDSATEWLVIRADGTTKRIRDLELVVRYTRIATTDDALLRVANAFWLPGTRLCGWWKHRATGVAWCVRATLDADPTYYLRTADDDHLVAFRAGRFAAQFDPDPAAYRWVDRFVAPHTGLPVTIAETCEGLLLVLDDHVVRVLSHEQFAAYTRIDPHAYWMVHCSTGTQPRFRHETLEQARTEARRLAHAQHGAVCTVLQAVHSFVVRPTNGAACLHEPYKDPRA